MLSDHTIRIIASTNQIYTSINAFDHQLVKLNSKFAVFINTNNTTNIFINSSTHIIIINANTDIILTKINSFDHQLEN